MQVEPQQPADPPFGRLHGVRKEFERRGEEPLLAIEDISFDVADGELISLLGPSGCGKTTVLRIFAGLTEATAGTVEIRGERVVGPQRDFGVVFQSSTPIRIRVAPVNAPVRMPPRFVGRVGKVPR